MDGVNELHYTLAVNALKKLLTMGMISEKEYAVAEGYIAEKFRPLLRSI